MNDTTRVLVFISFVILLSCSGNSAQNKKAETANLKLDSINVIMLNEKYDKQLIELYNADGTLWKSFKLTDDFEDLSLHIRYKPDYNLLVFECVGRKGPYYEIIVDKDTREVKYIKPGLDFFNYETWEKHIVNVPSVDFNPKTNPIQSEPLNKSTIIPFDEEQNYQPKEVKGQWLRIIDDNEKSGWIKWIDDKGNLLIELYYLC